MRCKGKNLRPHFLKDSWCFPWKWETLILDLILQLTGSDKLSHIYLGFLTFQKLFLPNRVAVWMHGGGGRDGALVGYRGGGGISCVLNSRSCLE
jgi:hypothetical protein